MIARRAEGTEMAFDRMSKRARQLHRHGRQLPMTDIEKDCTTSAREVRDWIAAFERDPPLYSQFPLTLQNERSIPGLHVVCSTCQCTISGDRVRGRAMQSLPHVVTVIANAMCTRCDRITHINVRFRADGEIAVVEWLGRNGRWQARPMQPRSLRVRLGDAFRRLLTRLSSRSP
jgi:hypothetical protein